MHKVGLWCVGLLTSAALLSGQAVSTSQIRGIVQDQGGLAIPGAEVKLTQTATGAVRTVTSEGDGSYILPGLPVGPYTLEVTKQGFDRYVRTGIVLQVDVNPTIDVTMRVGGVTEQVAVQADAAMVETQNTSIGQVVDETKVVELPLNGRQATDLIYLTPGVTTNNRNFRFSYPTAVSVSVAGGAVGSVAFELDGGNHNDALSNQNLPLPFPDALQEFKVETSSLPAQYGYYASGSVNAVTKSGTNGFHGDLFEFVRNYIFNARNTFDVSRDNLKRNQFGGTIGGPIIKDKLFFFLGYQDSIIRSSPDDAIAYVPTPAMLGGNFSATMGQGSACPFFAPAFIPPGFTISPISLAISARLPVPTDPCGKIYYPELESYTEHQGIARVDYQLSTKHTLFGRYFISHYDEPGGAPYPTANLLLSTQSGYLNQAQNLTIGDTYVFTPRVVNSFRGTFTRSVNTTEVGSYGNLPSLGVQGLTQLPAVAGTSADYISSLIVVGAFSIGSNAQMQPFDTLVFSDDISVQRGSHQMSFGGSSMDIRSFAVNYLLNNGNPIFSSGPPSLATSGSAIADFVYGRITTFTQLPPALSLIRQLIPGLYGQDSWKVSRRLTLNLGVRWDPFLAHEDAHDHVYRFSMAAFEDGYRSPQYANAPIGLLFPGDPGGPTGSRVTNDNLLQFSPRVGIAWDPLGDGKMSIRAGWGIFYNFPSIAFDVFGNTVPFGGTVTIYSPTSFANPYASFPGGVTPFPGKFGTPQSLFPPGSANYSYPQNTPTSSVQQFNFSIQRQWGSDWLTSASFVGNTSSHLWIDQQLNPGVFIPGNCVAGQYGLTVPGPCSTTQNINYRRVLSLINPNQTPASNAPFNSQPFYANVDQVYPYGTGSYNALVLVASHRLAQNFSTTANYTWGHCISDLSSIGLGLPFMFTSNPNNPRGDRGNCAGADVRQTFSQSLIITSPKFENRIARTLLGDWRLGLAIKADSGSNLTVNTVADFALNGNGFTQRPNQVLSDVYLPNRGQNGWLNPAAFAPVFGGYGNLGSGNIQGPGAVNIDMSLARIFRIHESQQIEFRAEAFNLPNIVNLYPPDTTLVSPTFGKPIPPASPLDGPPISSPRYDPRILQFALKYIF